MSKRIALVAACIVAVLLLVGNASTQDPVVVNRGKYIVVFENERVRLLEYRDNPGDVSLMHEHPDHLVYSLSAWEREFTLPDGTTSKGQAKAGDAFWAPAGVHAGKNIGRTPTHALIFELKDTAASSDTREAGEP